MKNSVIVPIAILFCSVLVFYDTQYALAFSITGFNNGTADIRAIAIKDGETNFAVADVGTNSVYVRNQNTKALVGSAITGVTSATFGFVVGTQANRGYFFGGPAGVTVYEIDLINIALLRSTTVSCNIDTNGIAIDYDNGFLYCADTAEVVRRFSLATFTTTFSSTTLNAGATPCDRIKAMSYDSTTDTLFAGCTTTANIVAVIGITVSGTPDFSVAYSASVAGLAFNDRESNVAVCSSGAVTPRIYDFSPTTGFALLTTIGDTSDNCNVNKNGGRIVYDHLSDRFFFTHGLMLTIYDATDGNSLIEASVGSGANDGPISVISNFEAWGILESAGANNDYYVVDLTGIPLGSNGEDTPSGGGTGGIDCTLPENAQILICRLGGEGCENNVLGCVGNTVLGNATDGTGLTGVICGVGFVDCQANPDIKTNGIGYLLLAIALGIEIGILWVASRGDLRQVPTFIWFIATIAIIAALTLFNWIDATMLVLGVIVAVALAAAKARGFFGGDSF